MKIINNEFKINHKKILMISVILLVLSLISILWFDNEIYFWINKNIHHYQFHASKWKNKIFFYEFLTSEITLLWFVILLIVLMLFDSQRINSVKTFFTFVLYQFVCLFLINYIKVYLKYFFGRCVPEVCFLPKYYPMIDPWGFSWFSFVSGFASFPSGHSLLMGYCLLWSMATPSRLSGLVSFIFIFLLSGLILFNYHFLGDCLAGAALGLILGSFCLLIWSKIRQYATNQAP